MTNQDAASLVREAFGRSSGRTILPGDLPEYNEIVREEDVTPLQAMTWIAQTWAKYENGRNFYPTKLEKIIKYADLMSNGVWHHWKGADTIDITDGTITGGRHRLHAVLLSHTTQKFNVRYRTKKES